MRICSLSIAIFVAGCLPPEPPESHACLEYPAREGPVVARVGQVSITVAELVERIGNQGSAARQRISTRKELHRFVEDQIRLELLAQVAMERGLHNDPDVIEAARALKLGAGVTASPPAVITQVTSYSRGKSPVATGSTTFEVPLSPESATSSSHSV